MLNYRSSPVTVLKYSLVELLENIKLGTILPVSKETLLPKMSFNANEEIKKN